jgi:hypothetical protein
MTVATTKIGFFTAAAKPSTQEAADILIMQNLGFDVKVRNALGNNYTDGDPEAFDYVMDSTSGTTIPAAYANTTTYPRTSKTAPPAPTLLSTQTVITSGVEFAGNDKSGTYVNGWTPTIVAGVVSTMLAS